MINENAKKEYWKVLVSMVNSDYPVFGMSDLALNYMQ